MSITSDCLAKLSHFEVVTFIRENLPKLSEREIIKLIRENLLWFTPRQASVYLHFSIRTLESWRASGKGPAYEGKGKNIRYHIDALDAFMHGKNQDADHIV